MSKKPQGLLSLTILVFMAACAGKKTETKVAGAPPVTYQYMVLAAHSIGSKVQLPGVLQPFEFVQLFPKVTGFVKQVTVDRGSVVRQGQVLLTLEAPEIQQQVAEAKLKYTQAEANYRTSEDRYSRLIETSKTPGTIAAYDLQAALSRKQADSATTQAEYASYKAAEAMFGYLTITAPFDGVITERNIHPGALAGPGMANAHPMLVLNQLSKLRLVVEVPEQYAQQVNDGDPVVYKINALPGREFTGAVARSSHNLSSDYRSEAIEIDVQNPNNIFKPGMYAEVLLPASGSANAFVVPKTAIVTTTERKYVVTLNYNITKFGDIKEGNQSADSVEIFGADLRAGDKIITNASYQLREGESVK